MFAHFLFQKTHYRLFKFLGIYFSIENTPDVFLHIKYVIIIFVNSFQSIYRQNINTFVVQTNGISKKDVCYVT